MVERPCSGVPCWHTGRNASTSPTPLKMGLMSPGSRVRKEWDAPRFALSGGQPGNKRRNRPLNHARHASRIKLPRHILAQLLQPHLGLGVAGGAPIAARRERTAGANLRAVRNS